MALVANSVRKVTPKVLANFSPGVELWQPWDHECHLVGTPNPERVAPRANPSQSLQDCDKNNSPVFIPRVVKAQPWAEIGQHLRCNPAAVGFLDRGMKQIAHLWCDKVRRTVHKEGQKNCSQG
jgi:hypothetical protein